MKREPQKYLIYTNDWHDDSFGGQSEYDHAREFLFEEYAESKGWKTSDDIPEDYIWGYLIEEDQWSLDDFKGEMSHFLKDNGPCVLTGSVGTWQGDREGGKLVYDFNDFYYSLFEHCDYATIWDEGGHLKLMGIHHDGRNYGELRVLTGKGVALVDSYGDYGRYEGREKLCRTLFGSNIYSRLPHYARDVYGCKER